MTVDTPTVPPAPTTRRAGGTSRGGGWPVQTWLRLSWAAVLVALVGFPLFGVVRRSLEDDAGRFTLDNYALLGEEPQLVTAVLNSLWIAAGSTIGALVVALPMAWLVTRTDLPFRRMLRSTAVLTFSAPSFIIALGWVLLLGPRNGLLNDLVEALPGIETSPLDIFGPWGIIFVLSLFTYPLVLLPVAAALEGIDPALEHAAANQGASPLRVLRTITFPVVLPTVLAGSVLVFVASAIMFGPVAILGSPTGFQTIPTLLFSMLKFPPRIEVAAVVAVPIIVMIAGLLLIQHKILGGRRFVVIGGKATGRTTVRLGLWKWVACSFSGVVVLLSIVLPFGVLLVTSTRRAVGLPLGPDNFAPLDNYRQALSQPQIVSAFTNSVGLALAATVSALLVSVVAAWLRHRTVARTNSTIPAVMASPLAFPGAVFAIGLILSYGGTPFGLSGTLLILYIAYTAHALPTTFSYVDAAVGQIGPEIEEASRSLGAGWTTTLRRVTIPLLRPALLAAGLLNFVILLRELEMSIFLFTGTNSTISVALFNFAADGSYQLVGALSVVVLVLNAAITLLAIRFISARPTAHD